MQETHVECKKMRHPKRTIKAVTRGGTQTVNKSLERYFISLVFRKMQNKMKYQFTSIRLGKKEDGSVGTKGKQEPYAPLEEV